MDLELLDQAVDGLLVRVASLKINSGQDLLAGYPRFAKFGARMGPSEAVM
jgi:hypothetical protein